MNEEHIRRLVRALQAISDDVEQGYRNTPMGENKVLLAEASVHIMAAINTLTEVV